MNYLFSILFKGLLTFTTLVIFHPVHAQTEETDMGSLYRKIQQQSVIPERFISFAGAPQRDFQLIDSFRNMIGNDSFVRLIDDPSYSLKYWVFIYKLQLSDSFAIDYIKLHMEHDSTVLIQEAGCGITPRESAFSLLLMDYFEVYVAMKYQYSGSFSIGGIPYQFEKPDKQRGRKLKKELKKLRLITKK